MKLSTDWEDEETGHEVLSVTGKSHICNHLVPPNFLPLTSFLLMEEDCPILFLLGQLQVW